MENENYRQKHDSVYFMNDNNVYFSFVNMFLSVNV